MLRLAGSQTLVWNQVLNFCVSPREPVEFKTLKGLKRGRSFNEKPGPNNAPQKTILLTLKRKSSKYFL